MAILTVFKSRIPFCNYITSKGKQLSFAFGKFCTSIEDEIKELTAEVESGHPHIYIDEAEKVVDSTLLDPAAALKKKIIDEYIAQQAAATDPARDMGTSAQGQVVPASSLDVAEAAAGGSGTQTVQSAQTLAARLASVKIGADGAPAQ